MGFVGERGLRPGTAGGLGVLLTNIGSPDAPTAGALRRYLAQFLADPRIVELPRWLWAPLLHGVLLNTRPRRSARLYQNIWTPEGSPLLQVAARQAAGLQARLRGQTGFEIAVAPGMRYGRPSIAAGLKNLWDQGVRRILILPLFPQYSATTTATSLDAVFQALERWRWLPEIRTVNGYHDHPAYVSALAQSVRDYWAEHGRPARLLFSFHGIPQSYAAQGDPYPGQCRATARLVAEQLGLAADEWAVSFQSRFGPAEWLRPYTDELLREWGRAGLRGLHVVCPGFSADCLETLDEIGREARHIYQAAGGQGFGYVPALNDRPDHLEALAEIALGHLAGWGGAPRAACHAGPTHKETYADLNH